MQKNKYNQSNYGAPVYCEKCKTHRRLGGRCLCRLKVITEDQKNKEALRREELLLSREFWVMKIALNMWEANGKLTDDSDKEEELAEKIVDEHFMNAIKELTHKL